MWAEVNGQAYDIVVVKEDDSDSTALSIAVKRRGS